MKMSVNPILKHLETECAEKQAQPRKSVCAGSCSSDLPTLSGDIGARFAVRPMNSKQQVTMFEPETHTRTAEDL